MSGTSSPLSPTLSVLLEEAQEVLESTKKDLESRKAANEGFLNMKPRAKGNTQSARQEARNALEGAQMNYDLALDEFTKLASQKNLLLDMEAVEKGLKNKAVGEVSMDMDTDMDSNPQQGKAIITPVPVEALDDVLEFERQIEDERPIQDANRSGSDSSQEEEEAEQFLIDRKEYLRAKYNYSPPFSHSNAEGNTEDGGFSEMQLDSDDEDSDSGKKGGAEHLAGMAVAAEMWRRGMGMGMAAKIEQNIDDDTNPMQLDDGFIAKLQPPIPENTVISKKPKKPKASTKKSVDEVVASLQEEIASLVEEDQLLSVRIEKMRLSLQNTTLDEIILEALAVAIDAADVKRDDIEESIIKLQAKLSKTEKGKVKETVDDMDKEAIPIPEAANTQASDKKAHQVDERWYHTMTEEEKIDFANQGRMAISLFLEKKSPIPYDHRRLMRFAPDYLPECSYTTRDLALHILRTTTKLNTCPFHSMKASRKRAQDKPDDIIGVPFTASSIEVNALKGALSCGCNINEVLLDFILYKVGRAKSSNPAIPLLANLYKEPVETRHRTYMVQAFTAATGLTVDDIYTNGLIEFGSRAYLITRIAKILDKKINLDVEEEEQVLLKSVDGQVDDE
ncbi:hypothetical protein B0H15DRAFT_950799 [Mycena belliarum]|uniref:Uncharacterized protein n=1 Tax=Mycena belliarum TaxID=1033014 RepID=A0AAD6U0C4_9AGAR|nr:hypothetical protein B0H15DRAFT_950799 [Mycena belliae]